MQCYVVSDVTVLTPVNDCSLEVCVFSKVPKTTFECKTEKVFDGYQITQQGYEQQQSYGKQQGYGKQGDDQQGYGQHPKYRILKRCFSKVVYETKKEVRTRYDTKLETIPAGGFESCMGPITEESAQSSGVDNLTCRDNCYARKDSYGSEYLTTIWRPTVDRVLGYHSESK